MDKRVDLGRKKVEIKKIEKKHSRLVTSRSAGMAFSQGGTTLLHVGRCPYRCHRFLTAWQALRFRPPLRGLCNRRFPSRSDSATVSQGPVNKGREAEDVEAEPEGLLGLDASWLDMPIENMGLDEREWYNALLKELRDRVATRVNEMERQRTATREYFPVRPVVG